MRKRILVFAAVALSSFVAHVPRARASCVQQYIRQSDRLASELVDIEHSADSEETTQEFKKAMYRQFDETSEIALVLREARDAGDGPALKEHLKRVQSSRRDLGPVSSHLLAAALWRAEQSDRFCSGRLVLGADFERIWIREATGPDAGAILKDYDAYLAKLAASRLGDALRRQHAGAGVRGPSSDEASSACRR